MSGFRVPNDCRVGRPRRTIEDALDFIASIIENEGDGLFYWAITITGEDKLIGTICLFDFLDDRKKCEIGYELLPKYSGHGIMIEAAKGVIAFAAEILGLKTIDALTHSDNQSSTKLLQKLSFKKLEDKVEANHHLILFRLTT